MKFYLIQCKHGHVGRDKYLPLVIPVHADSVEQAIGIALYRLKRQPWTFSTKWGTLRFVI